MYNPSIVKTEYSKAANNAHFIVATGRMAIKAKQIERETDAIKYPIYSI